MVYYTLKSPAKLNLHLHITGKKEDECHILQSLVYFTNIYDLITVKKIESGKKSQHCKIRVIGEFAKNVPEDENNLIYQGVKYFSLLLNQENLPFYEITLQKNIPVGAGMGGGSGNVAAILNFLSSEFPQIHQEEIEKIATSLGADIKMMLNMQNCWIENIGDHLTPLNNFGINWNILCIFPKKLLSTKEIYQNFNGNFLPSKPIPQFLLPSEQIDDNLIINWLKNQENSLQNPAIKIMPEIAKIIKILEDMTGCLLARMTGSGSACFGIFKSSENIQAAEKYFTTNFPEYWVKTNFDYSHVK